MVTLATLSPGLPQGMVTLATLSPRLPQGARTLANHLSVQQTDA